MTKEQRDNINKQLTYVRNVAVLLNSLFKPVPQHMRDSHCDQTEAIDRIDKAYDFLKKYAVNYLETATKQIKDIVEEDYNNTNINQLINSISNKL